ncbi:MAG: cache domain-containing protein, partial [bacterium]|nr:cache domain-containing protein [bacterium]
MNEVKDRVWFLREGLFAKYVVALVGLVVFVLAVNGAMEIWITYTGVRSSLTDGMSEKSEATAKRIQQSIVDLDRQINWVTRASSTKLEDRRADYTQLLNQVPAVSQLSLLSAQGREQLRLSRQTVYVGTNADFSRDLRFTETAARGTNFAPPYFRDGRPFMSIGLSHSDQQVTVAEIDLRFLADFLGDTQVGKVGFAYVVDGRGQVLASSTKGPEIAKNLSTLPQVAAVIAPGGVAPASGTDGSGNAVLTASSPVQRLGWHVFFEQETAQALTPIRDQLIRIALLITLG